MKKTFLAKNLWLKLASFILAVALWFFVVLSGRLGIVMDIPIMYINVPRAYEVVDFPKTVSVSIEGQERLIRNLKQNEISAVIDLSNAKEGKSFYTSNQNRAPYNCRSARKAVEQVRPGSTGYCWRASAWFCN
jgi:YbbR domain-containing protein